MQRTGLALLLGWALSACAGSPAPPGPPHCPQVSPELTVAALPPLLRGSPEVSVPNLRAWVNHLAAPAFRGRHATSEEARGLAALLAGEMSGLGLEAPFANGGYCQAFPLSPEGYNVVGHLRGPANQDRGAILVGAHYDGQGLHPAGFVYPSADDNASGIAGLFEVARLAGRRTWPFDLVFVAFGAEETGQAGAEGWIREPTVPISRLLLMINFDMVGRPWPGSPPETIGYQILYREDSARADRLRAALREASVATGVETKLLTELFAEVDMKSDSTVFARHVPALHFSTGLHEDYHRRTDTPDLVDEAQVARTVRLTLGLLERLPLFSSRPTSSMAL